MTRDGCRQVGIGRIGVGSVTVVTGADFAVLLPLAVTTEGYPLKQQKCYGNFSDTFYVHTYSSSVFNGREKLF